MYLYVIAVSISFFSVLLYYFIIPSPNTNTLHNILDGTLKTVYYLLCISKGYLHSRLSIEPSNCNRKTNINRCLVITTIKYSNKRDLTIQNRCKKPN